MHTTFLLPVWALVAYVLYKVVSSVVERRRHAAKAKQLGCQSPHDLENPGFFGINNLRMALDADKRQQFPDMLVHIIDQASKETGRLCTTVNRHMLGQNILYTVEPENIKAMLATQFEDYDTGPVRRGIMSQTLGHGIFVQDGKPWEHSRALLRPNFVRDQVSDLDMEERHVKDLMKVLPVQGDGWTADTNIQALFFRFTLDSATEFLFGESVNSQLTEAENLSAEEKGTANARSETKFSKNFDSAQKHMAKMFRFGDMFWTYRSKDFNENNRVVKEFADYYVNLALKAGSAEKKAHGLDKKDHYVFLEELAQQTQDPVEIRAQLLNILLAGRDTTSSLLSWLFFNLLRNPEVFDKLRSTIVETFGTYEDPQDITFSTLKSCQYLQYCLNETLRLTTIVPGNGRVANKDTTLPTGGGPDGKGKVYVKANTLIDYSIHVVHRRKDIWGDDAEEFKPERFIGRKSGWEFLPFNGGPRICIGQQLALTEASYVVVRLLQRFDKIWAKPEELEGPVLYDLTLTSCPGRKVTLKLHEAKA